MSYRHPLHGFTLIELLVVISIIALLIALLIPSLNSAKEQTRVTLCASNLHQFAAAIGAHAADNKGETMIAYRRSPGWNDPTTIGLTDSGGNYWNIQTINQYIQSFNEDRKSGSGIIICPSTDERWYRGFVNAFYESNSGFTQMTYSYFGGTDRWDDPDTHLHNSAADELARVRLEDPGRVLMNDTLLFDSSFRNFRYNHGRLGWAYNYPPNPGDYYSDAGPAPAITGINQLKADGSVRWKTPGQFPFLDAMTAPTDVRGRAGSAGGRTGGRGGRTGSSGYAGGWVGFSSGPRYY